MVILTSELPADSAVAGITGAFHTVFWWMTAAAVAALAGAVWLAAEERRRAALSRTAPAVETKENQL